MSRYRIRRNQLTPSEFLARDGTWTDWNNAAKFSTQSAADKFAAKHGIDDHGIF